MVTKSQTQTTKTTSRRLSRKLVPPWNFCASLQTPVVCEIPD